MNNDGVNSGFQQRGGKLPVFRWNQQQSREFRPRIRGADRQFVRSGKIQILGVAGYKVAEAELEKGGGYVRGDVTASWRQYTPQWDRARQFLIDVADNMESMSMAFGTLAGEFMRTKVIPETFWIVTDPTPL